MMTGGLPLQTRHNDNYLRSYHDSTALFLKRWSCLPSTERVKILSNWVKCSPLEKATLDEGQLRGGSLLHYNGHNDILHLRVSPACFHSSSSV